MNFVYRLRWIYTVSFMALWGGLFKLSGLVVNRAFFLCSLLEGAPNPIVYEAWCVLYEEAVFRGPLVFFLVFDRLPYFLAASIVLSVAFGYMHGGWGPAIFHGPMGFALCLQFAAVAGPEGKFLRAIASTSLIHAAWNAISLSPFWARDVFGL